MKQYIDKDFVVKVIKKIYNDDYRFLPSDLVESVQDFKDDLLIALDKETELEKKIDITDITISHTRALESELSAKDKVIEEACEWLSENAWKYTSIEDCEDDDGVEFVFQKRKLVEDFKEAMSI